MRRILTPIILEADMPNIMDMIIEEGIQKGLEEGIQKGREEGIQKGLEEGIQKGREEGIQKGLEEGIQKGREEMIRTLLAHGAMTPEQIASMFGIDLELILKVHRKPGA